MKRHLFNPVLSRALAVGASATVSITDADGELIGCNKFQVVVEGSGTITVLVKFRGSTTFKSITTGLTSASAPSIVELYDVFELQLTETAAATATVLVSATHD